MRIPSFTPHLIESVNLSEYRYDDGRVQGVLVKQDDNTLIIKEWNSTFKGIGFTKDALKWLRGQGHEKINAQVMSNVSAGEPPSADMSYWIAMCHKYLVDELFDTHGVNVTPEMPEEDEMEWDDLAMKGLLEGAGKAIDSIGKAMRSTSGESASQRAHRRLSVPIVMEAFSKGLLPVLYDLIEDDDDLYDMMETDPVRHAQLIKSIYALQWESSLELSSVLLNRFNRMELGIIKSYGSEMMSGYVMNKKGDVLSSNGVLPLKLVVRKEGVELFDSGSAKEQAIMVTPARSKELIEHFSWVTQLIAQKNGLVISNTCDREP